MICDTFTLIGIRGFNKNEYREEKAYNAEMGREPKTSEPKFIHSMQIDEVEKKGGCINIEPANPEFTRHQIQ